MHAPTHTTRMLAYTIHSHTHNTHIQRTVIYNLLLTLRRSTRNFNVPMAKAGRVTIAEVEEVVDIGEIDQEAVHVPGIYVNRIIEGVNYEKKIEVSAY